MTVKSANSDKILAEKIALESNKELNELIASSSHLLVVIDDSEHVINANKNFLNAADIPDIAAISGVKINTLIKHDNYIYENSNSTVKNESFIESLFPYFDISDEQAKKECRLYLKEGKVIDAILTLRAFIIGENKFTIIIIIDISEKKWKENIEKIFFHDILNSAGALRECLNIIDLKDDQENSEMLSISKMIIENLIEEILSHKQFLMAQRNEYVLNLSTFDCNEVLKDVANKARYTNLTLDKNLQVFKSAQKLFITSDKILLNRVIYNLVKNALEASEKNANVELYCIHKDNNIEFIIRNISVIPEDIHNRIFDRAFSTKGADRGLGTYSAKLLTERLLGGKLYFESNESLGTVFYAIYPETIS